MPSDVIISTNEVSRFAILRVAIDGQWSVENMRLFLSYLEDIYNFSLSLEFMRGLKEKAVIVFSSTSEGGHVSFLTGSPCIIPKDSSLQIRRVQYESPGITDIAGLGVIIGHYKQFPIKAIELATIREQRKLENQECLINNQHLQIEHVCSTVALTKEVGFTKAEVKGLMSWVSTRNQGLQH